MSTGTRARLILALRRHKWEIAAVIVVAVVLLLCVAGFLQYYIRYVLKSEIDKHKEMWPADRVEMALTVEQAWERRWYGRLRTWPPEMTASYETPPPALGHPWFALSRYASLLLFDTAEEALESSKDPAHRFMAVQSYVLYNDWDYSATLALERLSRDEDQYVAETATSWLHSIRGRKTGATNE